MRNTDNAQKYILRRGLCSGCGICASIFDNKIVMKMREEGYYRPEFVEDLSPEEWKQLKYVCPALNMTFGPFEDSDGTISGQQVGAKVGWSTSEDVRYRASSGGALTALLLYLLETKKITGVIHVKRLSNQLDAFGGLSVTVDDIKANMGSLYMPVSMLKDLRILLEKTEKVAIVGKGCDLRAVRRFVELNPKYEGKVVLYAGILCGGAPSLKGTYRILDLFGIEKTDLLKFRYRGYGWPGVCNAVTKSGISKTMSYNDAWAKHLGPTSPLVCKICFDGIADAADISVGDAWICDDGKYPSFDEKEGRNLIICRSERGKTLIEEAVKENYIEMSNDIVDNHFFRLIQPSQSNRRYLAKYKIIGLRLIGYFYPKVDMKYLRMLTKNSSQNISFSIKVRTVLGSIKRAFKGREGLL